MTCDARLFSPITYQTVFLGASVQDFNCSIGWNESASQLNVRLFPDPCVPTGTNYKVCYDAQTQTALGTDVDLTEHLFQAADPGFVFPSAGDPAYFRMGDNFEFGGIIQSYSEIRDTSQNPGYSVTIIDPREILAGCQVILNGYVGSAYGTPNLFNVYGFTEVLGGSCAEALLDDLTGPGAFGGSNRTENGISWNRLRRALSVLTSHLPALINNWSPYGRIKFGNYEYLLDWTEIPQITGYRFSESYLSIMDIINEITTFLGMDYFVELLHMFAEGGELLRIIKIRTVSRRVQPALNQISQFIGDGSGVIESAKGRELRNDVMSSVLTGGQKIDMFVQVSNHEQIASAPEQFFDTQCINLGNDANPIYQESPFLRIDRNWKKLSIAPFWGFKPDGGVIIGEGLNMDHNFTINVSSANIGDVENEKILLYYNISVAELHAALAGKDVWLSFVALHKEELMNLLGLDYAPISIREAAEGLFGKFMADLLDNPDATVAATFYDVVALRKNNARIFETWINSTKNYQRIQFNLDTLFQIVEHYATTYYGQQFMVRLTDLSTNDTFLCIKQDAETGRLVFSREVADGGWVTDPTDFMGLQSELLLDRFRLDDDRIGPFVRFNSAQNLKFPKIDSSDFVYQDLSRLNLRDSNPLNDQLEDAAKFALDQTLFLKCNPDPRFVFPTTACGNFEYDDPRVVITLPTIVEFFNENLTNDIPYFLQFVFREFNGIADQGLTEVPDTQITNILRSIAGNIGSSAAHFGEDFLRATPNAVCIPMISNIETYGPWYAIGGAGKTNYVQQEDLVPWNYGSVSNMNIAASLLVGNELTFMQEGEHGYISVPGLPTLKLGDELQSGGSSITVTRSILLNHEMLDSSNFTTATLDSEGWTGLYGPNVSNIDVSLSPGGATSRYTFRTFTPSFGSTNRYLAERIKRRGIELQKQRREFRESLTVSVSDVPNLVVDIVNQRIRDRQNETGLFAKSPHLVLVGQTMSYTSGEQVFSRSFVQTQNLAESKSELANYESKHLMSLDGLIRPVHISGFIKANEILLSENIDNTDQRLRNTPAVQPPVIGDNNNNLRWNAITLNPFLSPGPHSDTYPLSPNEKGHDIEFVARGSGLPNDLCIRHEDEYPPNVDLGYLPIRDRDCRVFGLRAPLILTGWGADVHGKPVPNASEDPNDPNYNANGSSDKFLSNWLRRSDMWKTGPLDARWDELRQVWTMFPGYKLVKAILCESLEPTNSLAGIGSNRGKARIDLYNTNNGQFTQVLDQDGNPIENECCGAPTSALIDVVNYTGRVLLAGYTVICFYNQDRDEYWAISSDAPTIYRAQMTRGSEPDSNVFNNPARAQMLTPLRGSTECLPVDRIFDVVTLKQPISKGSVILGHLVNIKTLEVIQAEFFPKCVVTDVNCYEAYSSNGSINVLEVCDATIFLQSNWTRDDCLEGDTDLFGGGCLHSSGIVDDPWAREV